MQYKKEIIEIGKRLFLEHLNHSHSGNLSIRVGNLVYITRSGSQLGFLNFDDIVVLDINQQYSGNASMEYVVHKSIYRNTPVKAIVHAHPAYTVALSLNRESIIPVDAEGLLYFPDGVPVMKVQNAIASDEVARNIPSFLMSSKVVVIRAHGIFCVGKKLEEAYKFASSIESSSKILGILR